MGGGGTGKAPTSVPAHLSPCSISMTGISSMMGYLRSQSLQVSHDSLYNVSKPSLSWTHTGHLNISTNFGFITPVSSFFMKEKSFYHGKMKEILTALIPVSPGSLSTGSLGIVRTGSILEHSLPGLVMSLDIIRE
jgi:hypothetical protein